jgi:ABC-type polysaccharide/polyol phosphate export permease
MSTTADGYILEAGVRERGRLRTLWRRRGLLWSFTLRELQVRYRQAALGFAWALLQPVALTLITTVVFHVFLAIDVGGRPYPVFVYTALLAWSFFHGAVSGAVPTLVNNAGLLRKIWLPRETLPLATLLAVGLDLLVSLLLWVVLLLAFQIPLHASLLWCVPLLAILVIFTAACSLFGAAINVRFRDVKHALPLLLQLLFFATPIVYPLSAVPAPLRPLLACNPLSAVVCGLRRAALDGAAPDPFQTGVGAMVALLCAWGAWAYFTRVDRRFADIV